jgi:hypothetical protein
VVLGIARWFSPEARMIRPVNGPLFDADSPRLDRIRRIEAEARTGRPANGPLLDADSPRLDWIRWINFYLHACLSV